MAIPLWWQGLERVVFGRRDRSGDVVLMGLILNVALGLLDGRCGLCLARFGVGADALAAVVTRVVGLEGDDRAALADDVLRVAGFAVLVLVFTQVEGAFQAEAGLVHLLDEQLVDHLGVFVEEDQAVDHRLVAVLGVVEGGDPGEGPLVLAVHLPGRGEVEAVGVAAPEVGDLCPFVVAIFAFALLDGHVLGHDDAGVNVHH